MKQWSLISPLSKEPGRRSFWLQPENGLLVEDWKGRPADGRGVSSAATEYYYCDFIVKIVAFGQRQRCGSLYCGVTPFANAIQSSTYFFG